MVHQSLRDTNSFLKDQEHYRKALRINVSTSTAIESELPVEEVVRMFTPDGKNDRIRTPPKDSAR